MDIIWEPLPKQREFLSAPEEEVLYGGAAGSGKSDCILIDALGMNQTIPAITKRRYTALIIRKTYDELEDLIQRSQAIYPFMTIPAPQYNKSKHTWFFPSGARIIFGNCNNDDDVISYQGSEYQYIGIEEIGQFETNYVYEYLKSRLRSSDPDLKCYMRATCNPSKYPWLREYFKIDNIGTACKHTISTTVSNGVVVKRRIRFISAKLSDNPYLFKNGQYEAKLMSLPEEERNSLLLGRWDSYNVKGGIYTDLLTKLRKDNQICKVNYDSNLTVYCVFDLGRNDTNPIIFAQFIGKEIRIFDHFEDNGKHISYYLDYIKEKRFNRVHIVLPHDAKAKRIDAEYSTEQQAKTLFGDHNVTVLECEGIELGISTAKSIFVNLYIDEKCNRMFECLELYKRRYNKNLQTYQEPIHDQYSNTADAFRYLAMFHSLENKPKVQFQVPNMLPFMGLGF